MSLIYSKKTAKILLEGGILLWEKYKKGKKSRKSRKKSKKGVDFLFLA